MEADSVVPALEIHPLTPDRWDDFEALFGPKGACAGCWCMWWRVPNKEYAEGEGNKHAMRALVEGGTTPGLIGYRDGQPVGWVSLGPRAEFRRFPSMRKDTFAAVDTTPVWSLVCFFVQAQQRGQRIAEAMLRAAITYTRAQGATVLEAYPVDVEERERPVNVFMGTARLFARAGFHEVARRDPRRPIVRLDLAAPAAP